MATCLEEKWCNAAFPSDWRHLVGQHWGAECQRGSSQANFQTRKKNFCDLLAHQNGLSITKLYCTLDISCTIRYDVWAIHDSMPLKESTFSQLSILCHSLQIDILVCKVVSSVCMPCIAWYAILLNAWFDQSSEKITKWENDRVP